MAIRKAKNQARAKERAKDGIGQEESQTDFARLGN